MNHSRAEKQPQVTENPGTSPNLTRRDQYGASRKRTTYTSVDELATEIGISRQAAYAALRRNIIPHIRIGKRFILPRSAIAEWLRTAGNRAQAL
jgi:excisionase family DNA binding protein